MGVPAFLSSRISIAAAISLRLAFEIGSRFFGEIGNDDVVAKSGTAGGVGEMGIWPTPCEIKNLELVFCSGR